MGVLRALGAVFKRGSSEGDSPAIQAGVPRAAPRPPTAQRKLIRCGSKKLAGKLSVFGDLEPDDFGFVDGDLSSSSNPPSAADAVPLLGRYSAADMLQALETFDIAPRLRAKGLSPFYLELDTSDNFVHKLFVWLGMEGDARDDEHLLVEMVFRRLRKLDGLRGTMRVAEHGVAQQQQQQPQQQQQRHAGSHSTSTAAAAVRTAPAVRDVDAGSASVQEYTATAQAAVAGGDSATASPAEPPANAGLFSTADAASCADDAALTPSLMHMRSDALLRHGAQIVAQLLSYSEPDFVVVEWTRMQNPAAQWTESHERSALPGQVFPPLGVGRQVEQAVASLARSAQRDALVNSPLYVHNAMMYGRSGYKFVNPVFQGIFETLQGDLAAAIEERSFAAVAQAVVWGRLKALVPAGDSDASLFGVRDGSALNDAKPSSDASLQSFNGNMPSRTTVISRMRAVTVRWHGEEMMHAVSARMQTYFSSQQYRAVAAKFTGGGVFWIDDGVGVLSEEEWQQAWDIAHVDTRRGCKG